MTGLARWSLSGAHEALPSPLSSVKRGSNRISIGHRVVNPTAWRPPGRGTPNPRARRCPGPGDSDPILPHLLHWLATAVPGRRRRVLALGALVLIGHCTSPPLVSLLNPPSMTEQLPYPRDVERGAETSRKRGFGVNATICTLSKRPASRLRRKSPSIPLARSAGTVQRARLGVTPHYGPPSGPVAPPHRQPGVTALLHRRCECGQVSVEPGYSPRSSVRTF
jgi:hypothetical protein